MTFSTNLKYLRKSKGYSQDYIAEKLGYKSFTTIQKWETGIAEPSVAKLKILSDMFNVSMDELLNSDLTNVNEKKEQFLGYYLDEEVAQKAQEIYEDRETRILLDAKRDLKKEDLDYIVGLVKRLKGDE
nr:helix-turn-helix transcriptional regulator [uncultured Aminipila sp.]